MNGPGSELRLSVCDMGRRYGLCLVDGSRFIKRCESRIRIENGEYFQALPSDRMEGNPPVFH